MSTIVPAASASAPIPSAVLAALQVVAAENADELARLAPGTQLAVLIEAAPGKGLLDVISDNGKLTLKLPANFKLPDNGELTLQVLRTAGGGTAFKLLAVNGTPLQPALGGLLPPDPARAFATPAAGTQAGPNAPSPALAQPVTQAPMASGQPAMPAGVTATVLRPAAAMPPGSLDLAAMPPAPPGMADLAPGTTLTLRIAAVIPAGSEPAPAPGPTADPNVAQRATPSTAASPPAAAATPAPAAPAPQAPAPAVAGQPPAQLAAAPAPVAATLAPASPAAPARLAGQVVSQPSGGNPVVQTPAGLVSLHTDLPLPHGASVLFEVAAPPVPPPPTITAAATPLSPETAGWPALDEAAATLAAADTAASDQMMKSLPQLGPRLAVGLAAFAGALRSGELRHAIGEGGIRGLEKAGRRDLVDRLKKEFKELADETARPLGNAGEWRVYSMPMFTGAEIDPVRLFVRRPPGEVDEDGGRQGGKRGQEQRFILEVGMTRLGRIQMDGLVIREDKRFDLILRTYDPLPEPIRRDITGIFAECSRLTGTAGQVVFQAGRFVELPPTAAGGTAITV